MISIILICKNHFFFFFFFYCILHFVQDIDSLQKVWEVTVDWNENWNVWKVGQFTTLQTESMESTTQELFKRLQKLQRELKVCSALTHTHTAQCVSCVVFFITCMLHI